MKYVMGELPLNYTFSFQKQEMVKVDNNNIPSGLR